MLHNDRMLPISERFFRVTIIVDVKVCIGDKSLRKYMQQYIINQWAKNNNDTCGNKTCINAMLLQSYFNKWRISQIYKLDKLYINSSSIRILQRSKNYFIEYKNQAFPNNSHNFFWDGLRDHIECSLLGSGSPSHNSGYKSTRLCPYSC